MHTYIHAFINAYIHAYIYTKMPLVYYWKFIFFGHGDKTGFCRYLAQCIGCARRFTIAHFERNPFQLVPTSVAHAAFTRQSSWCVVVTRCA